MRSVACATAIRPITSAACTPAQPSIAASQWSPLVADALSLWVASICPYKVDGRAVLLPTGLSIVQAESWKAEAARTAMGTGDDCDGSAAHVTSAMHEAALVAADDELAAKDDVYWQLLDNSNLLAVVRGFLGEDCLLSAGNTRNVHPGSGPTGIHVSVETVGPGHLANAARPDVTVAANRWTRYCTGTHRSCASSFRAARSARS